MKKQFYRLLKSDDGATAIEYGLIAALLAVPIVGGLSLLGIQLSDSFMFIANSFVAILAN